MTNFTQQQGLVQAAPAPETKPGHSLVVYEETKKGRTLFQVVAPGTTFRQPFLKFGAAFVAYHVTADRNLRLDWNGEQKTVDGTHTFQLQIAISYSVAQPARLVETLDIDPLRRVRDQAFGIVWQRVRQLEWKTIQEGGKEFSSAVSTRYATGDGAAATASDQLHDFAADYGLAIAGISIGRTLPESELIVAKDNVKRETEELLAKRLTETNVRIKEMEAAAERELDEKRSALELERRETDLRLKRQEIEAGRKIQEMHAAADLTLAKMRAEAEREVKDKLATIELERAELELRLHRQQIESQRKIEEMQADAKLELDKRNALADRDRQVLQSELEREKLRAKIPLELEQQHHRQVLSLRGIVDEVIVTVKGMLARSGSKVENFSEMGRALQQMAQIRDLAATLIGPGVASAATLGAGGPSGAGATGADAPTMAVARTSRAVAPLSNLLNAVCDQLGGVDLRIQRQLLADALHLAAEAMHPDQDGREAMDACRARVRKVIDTFETYSLDRAQVALLRRLEDRSGLVESLQAEP